ncbi:MAG: hypothetical protein G01um10143_731 [Parcubacteria group bacterium Gr01-1014_3]|nr:MAG: hypothetical protein G01um10143_731 [Parcubacteria group bacterium Gr01-1014_3]
MISLKSWGVPFLALLAIIAFFQFVSPNIPESDSFYYMGLGALYSEQGIFNVDFPWIFHSTIHTFSSSLWWGFGVVMLPFSLLPDQLLAIKIAGLIFGSLALYAYYYVSRREDLVMPLFWPFLLFFSAPNILSRFLMVRPQIISLPLSFLLFSGLLNNQSWLVFLASFGIAWFHLNFAWVPIMLLVIVMTAKLFFEKSFNWKPAMAVLSGVLLGWVARPQFWNAANLFYIQIFQQIFEKQGGLPLLFGKENLPLPASILFGNFLIILILWLAVIGVAAWMSSRSSRFQLGAKEKITLWTSIAISSIFFLLSIVVARRAYDFWVAFGVLAIAMAYSIIVRNSTHLRLQSLANNLMIGLWAALVFLALFSGIKIIDALKQSYAPNELQEVSLWLKSNSKPGEIVFNLHWADFSPLFFWNRNNYYVGGLDPIFQYSYDPSLYWKFHYLSTDQVTKKTCGAIECTSDQLVDTYGVLKNDFNAKYVVLTKKENPAVFQYLSSDSHYVKSFETEKEAVFFIK